MRRWFVLSRLPVAIGALMLIVPWAYLSWNTTAGEIYPRVRFRTKQTIAGAVSDAATELSLHAVLTGSYQASISRAVGVLSPVFKPAIRWKNQIYYTLLGTAGTDRVVVGRNNQLMESGYLEEYCSRDLAVLRPKAEAWAARLRTLQDAFEARGTPFLYLITPSKVAEQPEIIPAGYRCPGSAADRAAKLGVYTAKLTAHGVHFVDAASPLLSAREHYGIDMFPRGGTHWNTLAAALGTQQVIAAADAQHVTPPLTPFTFTWTMRQTATGADRDLLDIMNLPHPDPRYPVPEVAFQSKAPAGGCKPTRITEIGGSFLMGVNVILEKLACPPDITYWFYWDHLRFRYAGGKFDKLPADDDVRRASLTDTDLVLLEENDAALPEAQPAEQLMDAMPKLQAHD